MARIRFLYDNLAALSASLIFSSTETPSLGALNAIVPDRTLVWRSGTSVFDQWWKVDLASAKSLTAVAVANPVLHPGGSMRLEWSNDDSAWTTVGTFPAADVDSKITWLFFSSISHRYWRVFFTNTGSVSSAVELGYLFAGTFFEPTYNVIVPVETAVADRSVVVESLGGQRTTTIRPRQSAGRWQWHDVTDADLAAMQTFYRQAGRAVPFFHILDLSRTWAGWLAHINSDLARQFSIVDGRYNPAFDWIEAL